MKKVISIVVLALVIALIPIAIFAQDGTPTALPQVLAVILAAVSPVLIGLAKKLSKNTNVRYVIAIVLSAITGFAALYIQNGSAISLGNLVTWVGGTMTYAQFAWSVWKNVLTA